MEGVTFKHKLTHPFTAFFPRMLTKLQRNQVTISRVIALLLLALSAWLIGRMVWLPYSSTSIVPWHAVVNETNISSTSRVGIEQIKRRNLFGDYEENAKPKAVTPTIEDAPKTNLSLSLVGVVVVEPLELSLAIIANRNTQDTYGIDEEIEGTRATLSAVYSDRVVLDNSGRSETLMLQEVSATSSRSNSISTRRAEKPAVNYDEESQSNNDDDLDDIKQRIADNPSRLLQYVRMSKLRRDGSTVGYQLKARRSPELFESLGFQAGDIATQINGIDLTHDDALSQLTASMNELSEVSVTVERDGQPYDIYIQL